MLVDIKHIPDNSLVLIVVNGEPDDFVSQVLNDEASVNEFKKRSISALVVSGVEQIELMTDGHLAKYGLQKITPKQVV